MCKTLLHHCTMKTVFCVSLGFFLYQEDKLHVSYIDLKAKFEEIKLSITQYKIKLVYILEKYQRVNQTHGCEKQQLRKFSFCPRGKCLKKKGYRTRYILFQKLFMQMLFVCNTKLITNQAQSKHTTHSSTVFLCSSGLY